MFPQTTTPIHEYTTYTNTNTNIYICINFKQQMYSEDMKDFVVKVHAKSGIDPDGTFLPACINPCLAPEPRHGIPEALDEVWRGGGVGAAAFVGGGGLICCRRRLSLQRGPARCC